jgi:protoporphyrinogen oxidase
MNNQRICIIGAGLAGLASAYDLGRQGRPITLLESSRDLGGLASSIRINGHPVERFYHFICRPDHDLIQLVEELGIGDRLHWRRSRTDFFHNGRLYGFGSPLDLLRFSPVPFFQRIRFGLNVINSRYRREWSRLDRLSARAWLIQQIGETAYEVIWDPLLRVKFGDFHDRVSAAWIWHRINRVARSRRHVWEPEHLGYLEYGSYTVIGALAERLKQMPNVTVRADVSVSRIEISEGRVTGVRLAGEDEAIPCDVVVSTAALPVLLSLAPDLAEDYRRQLAGIDYLGVVCGLLKLRQPLTRAFWTNINDPRIPYNGCIEYTNLNRHLDLGGSSIVYIPYYLPTSHERFAYSDERLMQEFVDGLRLVNLAFDETWIEEAHISRAAYAQAICSTGFVDRIPEHQTPVEGLYITDSTQFYPEDRTISAAIRMGRTVARLISARRTN